MCLAGKLQKYVKHTSLKIGLNRMLILADGDAKILQAAPEAFRKDSTRFCRDRC